MSEALETIAKAEELRKWCVETLLEEVSRARSEGHNWDEIAEALSIRRQSAMARYAGKVEHVDLRTKGRSRRWAGFPEILEEVARA